MKKSIVDICKQKFKKQTKGLSSFTGIACNSKDQFYSQIYHFLVTTYKNCIEKMVKDKRETLREVEVSKEEYQKQFINEYLQNYNKEEFVERMERILNQNQNCFNLAYGQKILKHFMEENSKLTEIKYQYAIYCLKNNLAKPEAVLPYFEEHLEYNKDSSELQFLYLLILVSSQDQAKVKKAWVLLRELI